MVQIMHNNILRTFMLSKVYGKSKVVNEVSLEITEGEIYGLLGENGAGKTTFMKMISKLSKPTNGRIELFDEPLESNNSLLRNVGVMIETPVFYNSLSVMDNLTIHCKYQNINTELIPECLKLLSIYNKRNKRVSELSLGMKQRLGIARAIINNPKFLVLDEPINGLDPKGIIEIRELLLFLAKEQKTTILLSSHILSEIEMLADRIGYMDQGTLANEIDLHKFKNDYSNKYIEIVLDNIDENYDKISENFEVIQRSKKSILVKDKNQYITEISRFFLENNIEVKDFIRKNQSLEELLFNKRK